MKSFIFILFTTLTTDPMYSQEELIKEEKLILSLEISAFEKWKEGDVTRWLELSDDDVVYFDPMLEKRMDGLQNLKNYYLPSQGKFKVDKYEIINPKVQMVENMAVLTFNFKSYVGEKITLWNCTEVYRKNKKQEWKIIQTHWSFTKI